MSSRRMRRRLTAGLAVTTLAGAWVSIGCTTRDACHSGADSATASVEELLAAAVDDDAGRACRVTTETTAGGLSASLAELSALVAQAGGLQSLEVGELPELQMGSRLVVEVRSADPAVHTELVVYQSGGRYLVFLDDGSQPEVTPSSGEPTTSASRPAVETP